MKSIVISINPEHALNILKGDKTRELRKSVPKDFIGWVYVYVTKGNPHPDHNVFLYENQKLNGTIPFRFWFDWYDKLTKDIMSKAEIKYVSRIYTDEKYVLEDAFLTKEELLNCDNGKNLYAWHISKVEVFDKPMELGEFYTWDIKRWHEDGSGLFTHWKQVKHPPQSYQYVWVKGESNE